jgi:hypothetical protein
MQVYGVSEADDKTQFAAIYDRARQPGVKLLGSVPQLELARRLQEARVLAYPNHYAETFCIAAAEAQAAGCAVVTSALGALPETVGAGGTCIPGSPGQADYRDRFVEACVALLRDDERWHAMSERAVGHAAARYAWPDIAVHWESLCTTALRRDTPEFERVAVHLGAGRAALAQKMLSRIVRPPDVAVEAWEAVLAFAAWQTGVGSMPSADCLQIIALTFPSLRRGGVVDRALEEMPTAQVA